MSKKKSPSQVHLKILAQTLTLATSSLGLVAALAWNEAITEYVNVYIKPYFSKGSGALSLFIYAILITTFAVFVSYQLTKISKKITK